MGEGVRGFWSQTCKLNTHVKTKYMGNFPSFYFFFTFKILLFVFCFLPMVHSLHVQMDFFTHGQKIPRLIRN